jgi:hypothetical protein
MELYQIVSSFKEPIRRGMFLVDEEQNYYTIRDAEALRRHVKYPSEIDFEGKIRGIQFYDSHSRSKVPTEAFELRTLTWDERAIVRKSLRGQSYLANLGL